MDKRHADGLLQAKAALDRIRKSSSPISKLEPSEIKMLLVLLTSGAHILVDAGMPPGNIGLASAGETLTMVIFHNTESMYSFAHDHGLTLCRDDRSWKAKGTTHDS